MLDSNYGVLGVDLVLLDRFLILCLDLLEHMHLLLLRLLQVNVIACVLVVHIVAIQLQVDREEFQDVLPMFKMDIVHSVSSVQKVEMEPSIVGLVIVVNVLLIELVLLVVQNLVVVYVKMECMYATVRFVQYAKDLLNLLLDQCIMVVFTAVLGLVTLKP